MRIALTYVKNADKMSSREKIYLKYEEFIDRSFLFATLAWDEICEMYEQKHRHYHNFDHILHMLEVTEEKGVMSRELFLAILFHDLVYDPRSKTNEEDSCAAFRRLCCDTSLHDAVCKAILETKTHIPVTDLGHILVDLDLDIFDLRHDFSVLIDFEHKIFKEYQWVDYETYVRERVKILKRIPMPGHYLKQVEKLVQYVENRQIKIAVYPGSFNPFHIGHLDVLEQAEEVFDKVIIARGKNPDKNNELCPMPELYRQVETYDGLLTDFLDSLKYGTVVIRGIRNATDLQHEQNQLRFLRELKPDIKVISFFCDPEFSHVSSSAIRSLQKYNKGEQYIIK
jgi:pantetheine-phosphate adenylyltransferase